MNSCIILFSKHNMSLTCSGKVDGMVSNLQHYQYVTITNKTPYDTPQGKDNHCSVQYHSPFCSDDGYSLPAQQTWTASSRGACLVHSISAILALPGLPDGLECTPYWSVMGTSYSIFSILMKGDDACCVLSSHETQKCPDTTSGSGSRISPLASLASDPRTGNGM